MCTRATGTSDQTEGAAINASYNTTYATVVFPFKYALTPDTPNNEGLFWPIAVNPPVDSILNARDVDQGYLLPEQARAQYGYAAPVA